MADLTDIQAAQSVKLVGSSSAGVESTPINATANGDLTTADFVNNSVAQAALVIGTTPVECKVGGSNLANRKFIIIQAKAAGYTYGFSNSLQPFDLPNGATITFSLGPSISVWVVKSSGSNNVAVAELA